MKMAELENLTSEELSQKLASLKKELLDLRMLAGGGKLDKPHRINLLRKEIARVMTMIGLSQQPKGVAEKGQVSK